MSMAEALRHLRGHVPWLRGNDELEYVPPKPKTPAEDAEELVELAKRAGAIDRQSQTWAAVSKWCACELIAAQRGLETATGDRADALRSRAKTLRDMLSMDRPDHMTARIEDIGPNIP